MADHFSITFEASRSDRVWIATWQLPERNPHHLAKPCQWKYMVELACRGHTVKVPVVKPRFVIARQAVPVTFMVTATRKTEVLIGGPTLIPKLSTTEPN